MFEEAIRNFYEGINIKEVDVACTMASRAKIEKEPAYTYVSARLLLDVIYRETFGVDAHNPERAEVALAVAAVNVVVPQRVDHAFLRALDQAVALAVVALGARKNSLVTAMRSNATLDSGHLGSPGSLGPTGRPAAARRAFPRSHAARRCDRRRR